MVVLPAYAGMIHGLADRADVLLHVLPAYAGMIPRIPWRCPSGGCAPRVCGDDPGELLQVAINGAVLPAYAGMIRATMRTLSPALSAPRVCGDDPRFMR